MPALHPPSRAPTPCSSRRALRQQTRPGGLCARCRRQRPARLRRGGDGAGTDSRRRDARRRSRRGSLLRPSLPRAAAGLCPRRCSRSVRAPRPFDRQAPFDLIRAAPRGAQRLFPGTPIVPPARWQPLQRPTRALPRAERPEPKPEPASGLAPLAPPLAPAEDATTGGVAPPPPSGPACSITVDIASRTKKRTGECAPRRNCNPLALYGKGS